MLEDAFVKRLIQDIRTIAGYPYVPAVVKIQMIGLRLDWHEASAARDWAKSAARQDMLTELEREYLPLPALNIPNEESALYAAALRDGE